MLRILKSFFDNKKLKKELIIKQKEIEKLEAELKLRRENIDHSTWHTDCPICLSKLKFEKSSYSDYYEGNVNVKKLSCINGCYLKHKENCDPFTIFYIFEKEFKMWDGYLKDSPYIDNVKKEIEHWAIDEKYLAKLLTAN